ncbi:hypothetical protein WJX81_003513 [Elliptochloris bilobata]|uniref:Nuclear cap-binding protein subunit 3 n=1 Tax=Elliptochloris bilobata TaxID=381761 RepID=A0AAW1S1I4_9CHLO
MMGDVAAAERPAVNYGDIYASTSEPAANDELAEMREKHKQRAARFGTDYREPEPERKVMPQQAAPRERRERQRKPGFKTGLDIFSEEEVAKRNARAERFNTAGHGLEYCPKEREDAEVLAQKRKRAERFGTEYIPPDDTGMMEVDLLEARVDAPPEVARRADAVHLYGVDLLSTQDCLGYFGDYGPTFVEWLDDSSCNVLFEDAGSAKRAIAGRGRPLPPDNAAPDCAGLDPTDPSNMPRLWHKGEDCIKNGTPVPLLFRMATVADVKPPKGTKVSRFLWKGPTARKAQKTQRQRVRRPGPDDVDMADAEEWEEGDGGGVEADLPAVERADVADARELLSRPADERADLQRT